MQLNQFPDKETFISLSQAYNVIPVCVEILADMETPVSLLKKFYHPNNPIFLLESVEGGERWGRYSFLGVSANTHITVYQHSVMLQTDQLVNQIPHHGDPLQVLKTIMQRYKPAHMSNLPRFWGGMVGYLTYEMVSFFENIPNTVPAHQALAHFIIPDHVLIVDNVKNTLWVIDIVFLDQYQSVETGYDRALKRIQERLEVIRSSVEMQMLSPKKEAQSDHAGQAPSKLLPLQHGNDYERRVGIVKKHIVAGDIIQAVLSQPFTCKSPTDVVNLYRAQRFINPSPYLFFMQLGGITLVGSSPETMVRLENGVATLRPIAGTRPRGKTEQEDRALADELLKDEKEKAEHLMLVDLGRNDLGRIAQIGTVQVTDLMVVERYSHVMHLVSNIICDIQPDKDAWDLIKSSFPAGTLSGAPKIRAMQLIAELEETPRGPYGGAVGYISFNGNMDLAITIRTAVIENNQLTVRAGAGIVADSDPVKERIECINKAKAIQKALELIDSHQTSEEV
ncbi:MAG: chorismate-binding protein [Desulfobacterales bacterium]|nr:chorismate-binding protein [Desulfobacterales bacterium]